VVLASGTDASLHKDQTDGGITSPQWSGNASDTPEEVDNVAQERDDWKSVGTVTRFRISG